MAQKYGVQGYPTIKTFPAGRKKGPQDYNGPREAEGIVDYATGVSVKRVGGWWLVGVAVFVSVVMGVDGISWRPACVCCLLCIIPRQRNIKS